MSPSPFALAALSVVGLAMGSAVTSLAYRIPRNISWTRGRSICPKCGHVLSARDLVDRKSVV